MRLASFKVENYKGIALAELDGLASEPVVTVSGRNGTGKSLLLEALVGAWSGRHSMADRIGPWADSLSVEIEVSLTEDEWSKVDDWHARSHGGGPAPRSEDLRMRVVAHRDGSWGTPVIPVVLQILRNGAFQRENPFGLIDFLSANRLVPTTPSPTVDLGMLNWERAEQERHQMFDQFFAQRSPMSLPNVASYLVTLDYQTFLGARQGLEITNDYERLASAFYAATGKELRLPEYDPARGSNIEIQLPSAHRHGLSDLSSGEQEMLAMMYFVRRLSASGGILCIDEPEQHLHPTLQAALFDSMRGLANRAQILVVSHSVNLIAAAPLSALVQIVAPTSAAENQASRLRDVPAKIELVSALGITPADVAQSDLILVVEGDTDAQWLRAVFPIELGRAHVVVAGSANQVIDAHETLSKIPSGIPWLCLRDRDLMSDEELAASKEKYPRMHVWSRRAIENLLLDEVLISEAMKTVGQDHEPADVKAWLVESAATLRDEVLESLVDAELRRLYPPPPTQSGGTRFDKMEAQLRGYADVNTSRADALQETLDKQRELLDARWDSEWTILVNPKPVLEQIKSKVGVFKTAADLKSALFAKARDDLAVRPAGLEELRSRIASALADGS